MDTEKSYSEAMNEWARKNSFFGDRGNRLIHPNPAHPLPLRVLGYLFRIAAMGFVIALVANFGLRKYIGSKGFGEKVGGVVAEAVGAEKYEASALLWKGRRMSLNRFSATGGERAFFHDLEIQYARFDSSPLAFLGSNWELENLVLNSLEMKLRSGAKTSGVSASGESAQNAPLVRGGFSGGTREGKSFRFEELKVLAATVNWGLSEATRGSLSGAGMEFVPGENDWLLKIAGGVFAQNWLHGVTIEKLSIKPGAGGLHFEDGEIALSGGGKGTLAGTVALGALPRLDLTLTITKGLLSEILPESYATYADCAIEGDLRLTGSINTKSGVEISGDLRVSEGILRNLPALDSISLLTETTRLRHLPITSGTLKFHTREGKLEVSALDLASKNLARLTGGFAFARDMSNATEAEIIGLEKPATGATPLVCDGQLRVGVLAGSLESSGEFGDKYFSDEVEGFRWIDLDLKGEMPRLTRAVYDQMLVDIRKLRESR